MSDIPPTPDPYPYPTPPSPQPTETPLIPSWFYPLVLLLLIAGIITVLVVVYLRHKSLTRSQKTNVRVSSQRRLV